MNHIVLLIAKRHYRWAKQMKMGKISYGNIISDSGVDTLMGNKDLGYDFIGSI